MPQPASAMRGVSRTTPSASRVECSTCRTPSATRGVLCRMGHPPPPVWSTQYRIPPPRVECSFTVGHPSPPVWSARYRIPSATRGVLFRTPSATRVECSRYRTPSHADLPLRSHCWPPSCAGNATQWQTKCMAQWINVLRGCTQPQKQASFQSLN